MRSNVNKNKESRVLSSTLSSLQPKEQGNASYPRQRSGCRPQQKKPDTTLSTTDPDQLQKGIPHYCHCGRVEEAEGPYLIVNGILCRKGQDEWGEETTRPVILVRLVLQKAHGDPLAALRIKKSVARLLQSFYWPGVYRDMQEYRQRCAECQKAAKGSQKKAPSTHSPS